MLLHIHVEGWSIFTLVITFTPQKTVPVDLWWYSTSLAINSEIHTLISNNNESLYYCQMNLLYHVPSSFDLRSHVLRCVFEHIKLKQYSCTGSNIWFCFQSCLIHGLRHHWILTYHMFQGLVCRAIFSKNHQNLQECFFLSLKPA